MIGTIYETLYKIGYTHPLHPALTHLVVGLVIGGFLFGLVAWVFGRPAPAQTARPLSLHGQDRQKARARVKRALSTEEVRGERSTGYRYQYSQAIEYAVQSHASIRRPYRRSDKGSHRLSQNTIGSRVYPSLFRYLPDPTSPPIPIPLSSGKWHEVGLNPRWRKS